MGLLFYQTMSAGLKGSIGYIPPGMNFYRFHFFLITNSNQVSISEKDVCHVFPGKEVSSMSEI